MVGTKRADVVAEDAGISYFAPRIARAAGGQVTALFATVVPRTKMRFEASPTTAGIPPSQRWFTGGSTRIHLIEKESSGTWRDIGPVDLGIADDTEVQGACAVELSDSSDVRIWFSARIDGAWQIWQTVSKDGRYPCAPAVPAITPTVGTEGKDVLLPSVLRDADRWLMYYAGRDDLHRRIHFAESADGNTWTRQGVVLDIDGPGGHDEYAADCPSVLRIGGSFQMLYGSGSSRGTSWASWNETGQWTKKGELIGLEPGAQEHYAFYPAGQVGRDGLLRIYYAAEDGGGQWRILERTLVPPWGDGQT